MEIVCLLTILESTRLLFFGCFALPVRELIPSQAKGPGGHLETSMLRSDMGEGAPPQPEPTSQIV